MAVYKQSYRRYTGALTPGWRRPLVLARSALRNIFQSKMLLIFYIVCFIFPLIDIAAVYVANNPSLALLFGSSSLLNINRDFFFFFLRFQADAAFLFTAFAAPGLVAPDLANGGLTLYLARPLRRWEYLTGKLLVLWILLSSLTWVPGLLVFGLASELGGAGWRAQNWWIGLSLFLAAWIFIVVLSLLELAVSAWVKWRVVAGAALLAIYFFGAGFAQMVNFVLKTDNGSLLDIMLVHRLVWADMFRQAPPALGLEDAAWLVLILIAAVSLALVLRRIRPVEVVR